MYPRDLIVILVYLVFAEKRKNVHLRCLVDEKACLLNQHCPRGPYVIVADQKGSILRYTRHLRFTESPVTSLVIFRILQKGGSLFFCQPRQVILISSVGFLLLNFLIILLITLH